MRPEPKAPSGWNTAELIEVVQIITRLKLCLAGRLVLSAEEIARDLNDCGLLLAQRDAEFQRFLQRISSTELEKS